jgi:hypothetical protein
MTYPAQPLTRCGYEPDNDPQRSNIDPDKSGFPKGVE